MQELVTIILAAGAGIRMKSVAAKVTHKICGRPMLSFVMDAAEQTGSGETILILGHQADQVREYAGKATCILQENQLGTGHAVMQARNLLEGRTGTALILYGDTPVITSETLKAAHEIHIQNKNQVTVITAFFEDPAGYGRIVRDREGRVISIVEHKDADEKQRAIHEINSGMYFFEIPALLKALDTLTNSNKQGEYYLTDTVAGILRENGRAGTYTVSDNAEIMGVNDRRQLAEVERIINSGIIRRHMLGGVTFVLPETSLIGSKVQIGADTIIYPGTMLEEGTIIGGSCFIGPYSRISNSSVGNNVHIMNSVVIDSEIGSKTTIGPFAYLRPGSKIGDNVKIGDFVEIKKSEIKENSKVSHLTYIGDAEIGRNVNVGCGVVVVNYDGLSKHRTIVGDNAFIGCNVNLVSPVEIKDHAYIAAGSTITEDVPEYALAIARSRQTIIADWVKKKGLDKKK